MKKVLRRAGIFVIGWLVVIIGLVLAVPGIPGPGLLIALIGLFILSSEFHFAHRMLEWVRRRFPRFGALMDRAANRAKGWIRRHNPRREHAMAEPPAAATASRQRPSEPQI